jgi:hypothetical protein
MPIGDVTALVRKEDERTHPTPVLDEKVSLDEKSKEKAELDQTSSLDIAAVDVGDVYENVRAIDLDDNGKERPIETAADWSLRLVSLEDDPKQPVWTFRLWFISLGLSCFAAVCFSGF